MKRVAKKRTRVTAGQQGSESVTTTQVPHPIAAPVVMEPPPPLLGPDGPVRVIHVVAELAPFARSGGLGEAVASLARFQAASGLATAIVMPLYSRARAVATDIEPVGDSFRVRVGSRNEEVRLWKLRAGADDLRALGREPDNEQTDR